MGKPSMMNAIRFRGGNFELFKGDYHEIEQFDDILEFFDESYYNELESSPDNVLLALKTLLNEADKNGLNFIVGGYNSEGISCFHIDDSYITEEKCIQKIREHKLRVRKD